jgi:hypothetical protein
MRRPRLTTGFESLSDSDFETKASSISARMDGNPYFTTPIPSLTVIETLLQEYSDALIPAQTREKNAVAVKNEKRGNLTAALIQLASYVMTIANGDRVQLVSAGFDLAKPGESTSLVKPKSISVTDTGIPGELSVKVPAVKGATAYVVHYTPDPLTENSVWLQVASTTSKCVIKNLVSEKRYWCKMAAIGPYGQVVFSDAVSRVVQ